jgi:ADP-glucose pyrophosphorylase
MKTTKLSSSSKNRQPAMPGDPTKSLASMGIYVFDADYLYELLEEDDKDENSSHDFGKDIIPKITEAGMAYAHPFPLSCVQSDPNAEPYWRDVGTLEAYWKANLDLASVTGAGYVRPELADSYPYGIAAAGEVRAGPLR